MLVQSMEGLNVSEIPLSRPDILGVLNNCRPQPVGPSRMRWLYHANPDGPARVFGATDATGRLVGIAAALPRRMLVGGAPVVCWNCSDLSVLQPHRRRGVATRLRRMTREAAAGSRVAFLYGHPNAEAAGVHRSVGNVSVGQMVRYARPLQSAYFWRSRVRSDGVARSVARAVDGLTRFLAARTRTTALATHVSPATFDERFDHLFAAESRHSEVIGIRDSRYLSWRYTQNPLADFEVITLGTEDRLQGYLVFTVEDGVALVVDVFPSDPSLANDLLCRLVSEGYRRGWRSMNFIALDSHPVLRAFRSHRFWPRPDRSELFVFTPRRETGFRTVLDAGAWSMTVGDRDV